VHIMACCPVAHTRRNRKDRSKTACCVEGRLSPKQAAFVGLAHTPAARKHPDYLRLLAKLQKWQRFSQVHARSGSSPALLVVWSWPDGPGIRRRFCSAGRLVCYLIPAKDRTDAHDLPARCSSKRRGCAYSHRITSKPFRSMPSQRLGSGNVRKVRIVSVNAP